ncbi:DNA polymerase Y family protein [Clostridium estertheticum]|uniref:DNA polymerase IV n=1 Tax=Clostridium estertheticum TaxID=238834 RepID=A0AA47I8X6_9CLOT|nr:DNA polymerase IV [Clostridium estertheticum]MBU3155855.1 DNA polymerase IV [Clostridium estertheticum]WAG62335.1 DNA polymerase IV [Clostridium estertheticum]
MSRLIFHIDANSAYLSWEAAYRLQRGGSLDLRLVPSVIGGDEESRHGIVLTKSIPAKKFDIHTGETLYSARAKCPSIIIVPPRYWLYMKCSAAMHQIFEQYTPKIQRFSIDESFLDFSNMEHLYPDYMKLAETIKERVSKELGFTVNIGISNNKLLAKVASDFKKPNRIHTLFPREIKSKMWPLPVEDLFMVGRATTPKLHDLNINTIGELANYDLKILKNKFKSHGLVIWNYANGNEFSEVRRSNYIEMKGIGNSTTTPYDIYDKETAHIVLLSLCETVSMRLRDSKNCCTVVSISVRGSDMISYSRQKKLAVATDSTRKIHETVCCLFDNIWRGDPIRHLGVHITDFCGNDFYQCSLLDTFNYEKDSNLNKTIDEIRLKYGSKAISRSCFLHSGLNSMCGGMADGEEEYPLMSAML